MREEQSCVVLSMCMARGGVNSADTDASVCYKIMSHPSLTERTYSRLQIWLAVRRLDHKDERVRERAADLLRASGTHCWPRLRRIAFRHRSRLAVSAAELLYEMDDAQGLYALLTQYSDRYMVGWFGQHLRKALQRIGKQKILHVLEAALDRIEAPPITSEHWSLSLSVYALHALEALRAYVPPNVWRKAIVAYVPHFEDIRTCRAVVPTLATGDSRSGLTAPPDDWRVGSTVVAVRRAAVDALVTLERGSAFDLLREALAHTEPQVQLTAIYGLRRLRDPRAYTLLQPIAADRRHPLSRDARRAIESFGSRQPDVLTLMRPSQSGSASPQEMLRPATSEADADTDSLLRPRGPLSDAEPQAMQPSSDSVS